MEEVSREMFKQFTCSNTMNWEIKNNIKMKREGAEGTPLLVYFNSYIPEFKSMRLLKFLNNMQAEFLKCLLDSKRKFEAFLRFFLAFDIKY